MRNKQIVIYDNDAFYATRLEHFLSEREGNYFEISSFSERTISGLLEILLFFRIVTRP